MIAPRERSAEDLRAQMREIRGKLPQDVRDIVSGAKQLTDWRFYVRQFPWGSLATAATLGYLAVPRRVEVVRPDIKTLEELAKRQKLVVEPQRRVEQKPGLVESALNIAGNMILRAGLAYVGQQVGVLFGTQAAQSKAAEEDHTP
jgi:hypothetical protein